MMTTLMALIASGPMEDGWAASDERFKSVRDAFQDSDPNRIGVCAAAAGCA